MKSMTLRATFLIFALLLILTACSKSFEQESSSPESIVEDSSVVLATVEKENIIIDYMDYTQKTQPSNDIWSNYFKNKISEHTPLDTPIMITQSWTWVDNGVIYSAVNASNVVVKEWQTYKDENECKIEKIGLSNNSYITYHMSAIFIDEFPQEIMTSVFPISQNSEFSFDFIPSAEPNSYRYNVIQYNNNYDIVEYPTFMTYSSEFNYRLFLNNYFYEISDEDSDGEVEITFICDAWSSNFSYKSVYEILSEGIVKN